MFRRLFSVFIFLLMVMGVRAQEPEYMMEVGVGGGMSWTYGDVNRSKVIYSPTFAAGLLLRYNMNPRWSFVADLSSYGLKGDSKDFDNAFIGNWRYQYDNRLWHLAVRPEFHFWNYGWANDFREKKRIAPFITAGIGGGIATGDGDTGAVLSFPVGAGAKWKVSPRLNIQLTCLFTKTIGDKADGIKDPYGVGSSALANSDWVGSLVLSITYDFKERCFDCLNKNF